MLDITKEALTELGMRLHFYAAEATNGFYFARTTWPILRAAENIPHCTDEFSIGVEEFPILAYREVQANILYRSAFKWKRYKRNAAYCLMFYKSVPHEGWLYLGRTLEEVLAQLPEHGYADTERWLPDTYAHFCHHVAPMHQEAMWNSNSIGIVLQRSPAQQEAMPALRDLDDQPF